MLDDAAKQKNGSSTASISGAAAFELYDTYGYPLELTQELAAEDGVSVSLLNTALSSNAFIMEDIRGSDWCWVLSNSMCCPGGLRRAHNLRMMRGCLN